MAEGPNTMNIQLGNLTLDDTGVADHVESFFSDEYQKLLKDFLSLVQETDVLYARISDTVFEFRTFIKRLSYLSQKASLHPTPVTLDNAAVENSKGATSLITMDYHGKEFYPLLLLFLVSDTRERLKSKVIHMEKSRNIDEIKHAILISQLLVADIREKFAVCKSELKRVDMFLLRFDPEFRSSSLAIEHQHTIAMPRLGSTSNHQGDSFS